MASEKTLRTCKQGHRYYKSSDCPVCPQCEQAKVPEAEFLKHLAAPARRALESNGIVTLKLLSHYSEKDLLTLHGFGKASLPLLKRFLKEAGLSLKK
jgi:DNA-directed RNA polymerase alpha subunit